MKHFYKPLLLLLTTAVLLLGGCGVQQTASEQEKNITAENNAVFLAAGRNLAPGEKRRLLLQQDFRRLGTTDHQR